MRHELVCTLFVLSAAATTTPAVRAQVVLTTIGPINGLTSISVMSNDGERIAGRTAAGDWAVWDVDGGLFVLPTPPQNHAPYGAPFIHSIVGLPDASDVVIGSAFGGEYYQGFVFDGTYQTYLEGGDADTFFTRSSQDGAVISAHREGTGEAGQLWFPPSTQPTWLNGANANDQLIPYCLTRNGSFYAGRIHRRYGPGQLEPSTGMFVHDASATHEYGLPFAPRQLSEDGQRLLCSHWSDALLFEQGQVTAYWPNLRPIAMTDDAATILGVEKIGGVGGSLIPHAEWLEIQGEMVLSDWTEIRIRAMSTDGRYLGGTGIDPAGTPRTFRCQRVQIGLIGDSYCTQPPLPNLNSTRTLSVLGSDLIAANTFTLHLSQNYSSTFGILLIGSAPDAVPSPGGSFGTLCVGGSLGRLDEPPLSTYDNTRSLDLGAVPLGTGDYAIQPGETWYFQGWFRVGAASTANAAFSNALAVTFQ